MSLSPFNIHHSSLAAGVTLYAQMAESEKLDTVICKNLEALGYGT